MSALGTLIRDQRNQREFLAAEFRRDPHRHLGFDAPNRESL